jgi:hypothetical protein
MKKPLVPTNLTQDLNYRAAGNLHWPDFNENVQATLAHLNPTTTVKSTFDSPSSRDFEQDGTCGLK